MAVKLSKDGAMTSTSLKSDVFQNYLITDIVFFNFVFLSNFVELKITRGNTCVFTGIKAQYIGSIL